MFTTCTSGLLDRVPRHRQVAAAAAQGGGGERRRRSEQEADSDPGRRPDPDQEPELSAVGRPVRGAPQGQLRAPRGRVPGTDGRKEKRAPGDNVECRAMGGRVGEVEEEFFFFSTRF